MIRVLFFSIIVLFLGGCATQNVSLDSANVESKAILNTMESKLSSKQVGAESKQQVESKQKIESSTESTKEPISVKLSFVGDNTLGDYKGASGATFNAKFKEVGGDYKYFSKNVSEVLKSDDLSIGNLEGVLSDRDLKNAFIKPFSFKGRSDYVNILKDAGIDVVNIANNHTRDYGVSGFKDTMKTLKNAGIGFFGEGYLALLEIKGKKFGFAGERGWSLGAKQQIKNDIDRLRKMGADIIIFTFHFGEERQNIPNDIQRQLAHYAIDCGASLVVGHHPHTLQGIEKYKGKNIVYSLGNFIYGGAKNPKDKDSMIYQVEFIFNAKEPPNRDYNFINNVDSIDRWADSTILMQNIIPVSISSNPNINNYQPMIYPKDSAGFNRILNRLEEYSKGL